MQLENGLINMRDLNPKDFRIGNLVTRTIEETEYYFLTAEDIVKGFDRKGVSMYLLEITEHNLIESSAEVKSSVYDSNENSFIFNAGNDMFLRLVPVNNVWFPIISTKVQRPFNLPSIKYMHELQNLYHGIFNQKELIQKQFYSIVPPYYTKPNTQS